MKATLVLIGGGEIGNGETRPIDEKVRSLSWKETPHVLFLATASHDEESYVEAVKRAYGALGCEVEALYLWNAEPSPNELKTALAWADILYIGGGNTKELLERLKITGFDKLLIEALDAREDLTIAGLSAGASMWCDYSYADCDILSGVSNQMVFLKCLGYLPVVFNPHAQDEMRSGFLSALKGISFKKAYSLENDTALVIRNKKLSEFVRAYPNRNGWEIFSTKNESLRKISLD
jgi:dipeptidase E